MNHTKLSPIQHDYVTKNEFSEFKAEMREFQFQFNDFREEMYTFKTEVYDFRSKTEIRFNNTDKKLDALTRSVNELREEIPRHMAALREGFRDDLRGIIDLLKSHDERITQLSS